MKAKSIKKQELSSVNNILGVMAVVVVVIAVVSLITTFAKISEINKELNAYATATATGYINLTVNTALAVEFTPTVIYWGPGLINVSGSTNANITTWGNQSRVQGGNWSNATITGLIIKNTGNVNASLNFSMIKNVTDFFGLTSHSSKNYSINISLKESGSCNSSNNLPLNKWLAANASTWRVCNNFGGDGSYNELWVDVHLTIPYDANTTGVVITDTYTATVESPIPS